MNVTRLNNRWPIHKTYLFFLAGSLLALSGFSYADCWPTASMLSFVKGDVHSATSTWDISSLLTSTDNATESTSTTWTSSGGAMYCGIGATAYVVSPISGGYYVHFTDTSNDVDQWVKFTATADETSLPIGSILLATYYNLSAYQVTYTITAELVDSDSVSSSSSTASASTSIDLPVVAVARSSSSTASDALDAFSSSSWSNTVWIGYQLLNVTFSPTPTTCSATDTTVTLPTISPTSLKQGEVGSTSFTIPLTCSGALNSASTRNVSAWFYSADIVSGQTTVLRNSASDSSGVGVKILSDGSDLTFSDSAGVQGDATEVSLVSKGDTVGSLSLPLTAEYYVYDESSLAAGSLTATAVLYLNYD